MSAITRGVEFTDEHDEPIALTCSWFVLCDRPAVNVIEHPILGGVPTCAECTATYEANA
jgi:hypothetical protein